MSKIRIRVEGQTGVIMDFDGLSNVPDEIAMG